MLQPTVLCMHVVRSYHLLYILSIFLFINVVQNLLPIVYISSYIHNILSYQWNAFEVTI